MGSSSTIVVRRTTVERSSDGAPTIEGEWKRLDDEPGNRS
jgi:hypothetical protein